MSNEREQVSFEDVSENHLKQEGPFLEEELSESDKYPHGKSAPTSFKKKRIGLKYLDVSLFGAVFLSIFIYQQFQISHLKSANLAFENYIAQSVAAIKSNKNRIEAVYKNTPQFMVLDTPNFLKMKKGGDNLDAAVEMAKQLKDKGVITLMPNAVYAYPDSAKFSDRILKMNETQDKKE